MARPPSSGNPGAFLPRGRVLFLVSFFLVFMTLALWALQTWRHPSSIVPEADPRLIVLATRGLLSEMGATPGEPLPRASSAPPQLVFTIADDFPLLSFRQRLSELLAPQGYSLRDFRPPGQPAAALLVCRNEAPLFSLLLARRAVTESRLVPVEPPPRPVLPRFRVAVVIDDLGLRLDLAERVSRLEAPVTVAVIPQRPVSRQAALLAARSGKEVLLHLPMEPLDFPRNDPGPGALMAGMSPDEIARLLSEDLETVPGAVGINNHMGSLLTSDNDAMSALVCLLDELGLFMLDSRTSPYSVAYECARGGGLPSIPRDVFLDNIDDPSYVEAQFDELLAVARQRGQAVGIGHPRESTLAVLEQRLPRLADEGIELVPLSRLLR